MIVGQGLAILMSMGGAIWWASSLTTKVDALTQATNGQVEMLRKEQDRTERDLRGAINTLAEQQKTDDQLFTRVLVELARMGVTIPKGATQ